MGVLGRRTQEQRWEGLEDPGSFGRPSRGVHRAGEMQTGGAGVRLIWPLGRAKAV